jgi:hypothetical protein
MKNFINRKLYLDNLKKFVFFILFIIGITTSQGSFTQTVDGSLRAMSQSRDAQQTITSQRMCDGNCGEEYKTNAFSHNPNTMKVYNSCRNQCLQIYNREISCITSQTSSQYDYRRCTGSPKDELLEKYPDYNFTELLFLIIFISIILMFIFARELKLNKFHLTIKNNVKEEEKNIFCHQCGEKKLPKSKFCSQCQTKLEN